MWYKGAYERHLEAKGISGKINLFTGARDDAQIVWTEMRGNDPTRDPALAGKYSSTDAPEHAETDKTKFFAFIDKNKMPDLSSFATTNSYENLTEDDEHEKDMVAQLTSFAHKLDLEPKKTKAQKKNGQRSGPTPLTRKQLASVAAKNNSGELQLPDIELSSDSEYVAV